MNDMMCGKLLGDGCLTKQPGRKPRFQFTHALTDKGWSEHCFEELSEFYPLSPPKYKKVIDLRVGQGFTECYVVQSRTSQELSTLYEIWYPHGKKELPFAYIEQHFTERSLAWWYQDDGHLNQRNGVLKKLILSTDSFSTTENQFLIDFLDRKFGFKFSIDAQNRLILYDQFQITYFLKLVTPYIHDSMARKKLPPRNMKSIAKRSTIYLPADLILQKPTFEINDQYKKLAILQELLQDHTIFSK
ncbi:endonuclease [Planococcus maritimus]|uniref:endonuclease n=1 Tax=Planococcus maritimus TaxID=192421 RepID=UPI00313A3482